MDAQKKSPLAAPTTNGQGKGYKMKQNKYITEKAKAQMMAILAAAIGIFIGTFIGLQLVARGEENRLTEAWVLCQPDSYVNIRERASSRSAYAGMLMSGDQIWVDGRTKDGYAHCENMSNELGEGWVHAGYIVFEEPDEVNKECRISSNGGNKRGKRGELSRRRCEHGKESGEQCRVKREQRSVRSKCGGSKLRQSGQGRVH